MGSKRITRELVQMKEPQKEQLIDFLNRSWMTHDSLWFYECLKYNGIEMTNRINKAAIRALAPREVKRIKRFLGMEADHISTFEEFKKIMDGAFELCLPNFMNVDMSFPRKNIMHWECEPKECFAYKGMINLGVADKYECGLIYRIQCWIESLRIEYEVDPEIKGCLMAQDKNCAGDFKLHF